MRHETGSQDTHRICGSGAVQHVEINGKRVGLLYAFTPCYGQDLMCTGIVRYGALVG